jgi:hypothetical protein
MSSDAMRVGHGEAENYNLVTAGQSSASLSDARSLRGSTRAHVSLDMIHAEDMIEATILVLRMMLGMDHPLVISAAFFMAGYNADRLFIQNHVTSHCADHHEANFVRYFSVRLTNWFRRMESPPILLVAREFDHIFDRLEVNDPTWCPAFPSSYLMPPQRMSGPPSAIPHMAAAPASTVPAVAPASSSAPAPA